MRDEFEFRCVYCLEREAWSPMRQGAFSIDHVEPQSINPDRIRDYDNLVYACGRCNSARRDVRIIDPTEVPFGRHLEIDGQGTIRALSKEGEELILLLHLNEDPALENRRKVLDILSLMRKHPEVEEVASLFESHFRYPRILPDLVRYKPPGGNTRPDGKDNCHFRLRKAGKLPRYY